MNTRKPFARRMHRPAFTLLETILALALSAMLLASIYAAMDQSWKLSASGREEMERAQLARAIIHRISLDVRSITYTAPPPEDDTTSSTSASTSSSTQSSSSSGGSSGGSNSSGSNNSGSNNNSNNNNSNNSNNNGNKNASNNNSSSNSSNNSTATNASSAAGSSTDSSSSSTTDTEVPPPNSKSIGLRGSATMMEISISRPRRDLLPGTSSAVMLSNTSDLRQVTYSFGTSGTSMGLIRSEGDRMAVETVEAASGGTVISAGQTLAPEVSALSFRYYDGLAWYTTWDSDTNGRIPRAVEVMIAFPPPKRKPPVFGSGSSQSMNSFRTVISIPISDPFPKEFAE